MSNSGVWAPHSFYADLDPDLVFSGNADMDPVFSGNADLDPVFSDNADPNPGEKHYLPISEFTSKEIFFQKMSIQSFRYWYRNYC